jgi:two-component system cell cycle response regulator
MTALILVVDDIPANVKLLEAKLAAEYYDVVTARDGLEALQQVKKHMPDLVLLDVMMPGMDGFQVCRTLKADKEVAHIPVVMVTALSDPSDRVQGLEAGADDFITKPINDTALFARVRSLVRMKVLMDELRLRDKTGLDMGVLTGEGSFATAVTGAHIAVIDDDVVQSQKIAERLQHINQHVTLISVPSQAEQVLRDAERPVDVVMVSTQLAEMDGLRLATHLKSIESVRHVPIIMLVDEEDTHLMLKGLELGINDYLIMPVDYNEMVARVKTQIRRKKYQDALKSNYQNSISMAITDKLTGLYNRHYLDTHLTNMVQQALISQKPLSLMIMDMDHFKAVNDGYGHDVGDEVLKQLSAVIVDSVRGSDLAARFGGEEFVVLLPESDFVSGFGMAERIRRKVEEYEFRVSHEVGILKKTLSIGVATLNHHGDSPAELIKRADTALYHAKHHGRNQVQPRELVQALPATPAVAVVPSPIPVAPVAAPAMPVQPPVVDAPVYAMQPAMTPPVVPHAPVSPPPVYAMQPPITQAVPLPPQQPVMQQPVTQPIAQTAPLPPMSPASTYVAPAPQPQLQPQPSAHPHASQMVGAPNRFTIPTTTTHIVSEIDTGF